MVVVKIKFVFIDHRVHIIIIYDRVLSKKKKNKNENTNVIISGSNFIVYDIILK